jgi:TonB family protein
MMKKNLRLFVAVALAGLALVALASAGDEAVQATKTTASAFELQMRILQGGREKPYIPNRPVTSSYLEFMTFANFEDEANVATDEQIKKVFNLTDVGLLTEATLIWEKGKTSRAFHMFRINGQEYMVMVTPGRLPERNHFHIEVYEQSASKKASLLDTEFSLPENSAAVFGFEDTKLKSYFITLRVARWLGEPAAAGQAVGGVAGGVVPGVLKTGEKVKPPKLIKQVNPVYPEEARKAGVEGVIIMEATTDTYGRVASVKVLRSIPLLDQAAVDAVRQWVYEPMVINGQPQEVTFTVTVRFALDEDKKPAAAGQAVGGVVGGVLKPGGEKVKPPKLVREVSPIYPEEARKTGIEGVVIMEATTDTYGRIANVKVLRSIPLLDQAAMDALKQWVYEPMIINGKPMPVVFTVTIRFSLDNKKKPEVSGAVGGVEGGVEGGVVGGVLGGVADAQDLKKFEGDAVRATGDIKPPKLVKQVNPVYPEKARQGHVEGVVILEAKVDEQGNVIDARVLRSIPVLDQAAIDAVKQWKYEPLVIAGKAHKVIFTVTVRFMLKEGDKDKTLDKFAQGAVKAEGDIKPPRLIKEVAPVYPEVARLAEVQGVVILSVKTDVEGKVADVMILRSIPLLDQAAIDSVRQWVYEPFVKDGKAVPVVFTVTVRFQLK